MCACGIHILGKGVYVAISQILWRHKTTLRRLKTLLTVRKSGSIKSGLRGGSLKLLLTLIWYTLYVNFASDTKAVDY